MISNDVMKIQYLYRAFKQNIRESLYLFTFFINVFVKYLSKTYFPVHGSALNFI
jgi:hypothetical protein